MTSGNSVRLLVDGLETTDAITEAIERAQDRIWVETFILLPDETTDEYLRLLAEAASRGVEVVIVADQKGSVVFSMGAHRALEAAGVRVIFYNPLPLWRQRGRRSGPLLHSDHRKIIVADDVAFCGGHNLTSAYLDAHEPKHHDVSLRIEGPCTAHLEEVLRGTAAIAGATDLAARPAPPPQPGGVPAGVFVMDRQRGATSADGALSRLIRGAKETLFVMIAYFVPERWLMEELQAAASRGVDVRVMTAGESDFPFAREAARKLSSDLLAAGVRLFELQGQALHAKAAVADGEHLLVGSFDYNRFSAQKSLEVVVSVEDPATGGILRDLFLQNQERSEEMTLERLDRQSGLRRALQTASLKAFEFAGRI